MDAIISMTTWKRRIALAGPVIFSFLSLEPICDFKVVLVLSSNEFPGKEKDIPIDLVRLQVHPRFEILWTDKNTKAYKKYFPVRRKYPNVPIITVDDDEPAKENFLSALWKMHKTDETRVIYGYNGTPCGRGGIDCVRYGVGLYPPNSLFPLDEKFGMDFFKDMDDEYMRFLHVMKGTKYFEINAHSILHIQAVAQDSAMQTIMATQWKEISKMWDTVWAVFPEFHRIWNKNSKKSNR